MKNILTIENVREVWNVAHNNMTGDICRAALWMELNHDEIIGVLLGEIDLLQGQLRDFQKHIEIQGSSNIQYLKEIAELKARGRWVR